MNPIDSRFPPFHFHPFLNPSEQPYEALCRLLQMRPDEKRASTNLDENKALLAQAIAYQAESARKCVLDGMQLLVEVKGQPHAKPDHHPRLEALSLHLHVEQQFLHAVASMNRTASNAYFEMAGRLGEMEDAISMPSTFHCTVWRDADAVRAQMAEPEQHRFTMQGESEAGNETNPEHSPTRPTRFFNESGHHVDTLGRLMQELPGHILDTACVLSPAQINMCEWAGRYADEAQYTLHDGVEVLGRLLELAGKFAQKGDIPKVGRLMRHLNAEARFMQQSAHDYRLAAHKARDEGTPPPRARRRHSM